MCEINKANIALGLKTMWKMELQIAEDTLFQGFDLNEQDLKKRSSKMLMEIDFNEAEALDSLTTLLGSYVIALCKIAQLSIWENNLEAAQKKINLIETAFMVQDRIGAWDEAYDMFDILKEDYAHAQKEGKPLMRIDKEGYSKRCVSSPLLGMYLGLGLDKVDQTMEMTEGAAEKMILAGIRLTMDEQAWMNSHATEISPDSRISERAEYAVALSYLGKKKEAAKLAMSIISSSEIDRSSVYIREAWEIAINTLILCGEIDIAVNADYDNPYTKLNAIRYLASESVSASLSAAK